MLSRKSNAPSFTHLKLVKNVVKYLKRHPGAGLKYKRSDNVCLELFVDSSWANAEKRKSMFGFLVTINGTAVAFRTKKQSMVALSSTEAEYIGLAESVKDLLFVLNLLEFLNVSIEKPVTVWNDNQGAVKIANDLSSVARTRHISMKYFFVQDHVEKGDIVVRFKPTDEMLADMMTKALGRVKFHQLKKKILDDQDEEGVVKMLRNGSEMTRENSNVDQFHDVVNGDMDSQGLDASDM